MIVLVTAILRLYHRFRAEPLKFKRIWFLDRIFLLRKKYDKSNFGPIISFWTEFFTCCNTTYLLYFTEAHRVKNGNALLLMRSETSGKDEVNNLNIWNSSYHENLHQNNNVSNSNFFLSTVVFRGN